MEAATSQKRSTSDYTLIFGAERKALMPLVESAAQMAGHQIRWAPTVAEAEEQWGAAFPGLVAIVLNADPGAMREHAYKIRSRLMLATVPVIGVAQQLQELSFAEAFSAGLNDCCSPHARHLGRRLRQLGERPPESRAHAHRVALIADADPNTRLLLGRVFQSAGFTVEFASSASELIGRAQDEKVALVVLSSALDKEGVNGERLCRYVPSHGSKAAWIFNTPPKELPPMRGRVGSSSSVNMAVHDAFAAPDTLLFVANELVSHPAKNARKSERLLFDTIVRYRPAGRDPESEDAGYCYNIGAGGIYVRTLASPERGDELWVEFTPPRSDRLVRLEATVAWARGFGPGGEATAPSGFGLQFTGGSVADLARYESCYQTWLSERAARLASTQPPSSMAR